MFTIHTYGSGVRIPELAVSLDANGAEGDYIFVSHAHSDHIPGSPNSQNVYATPSTIRLMDKRGGPDGVTPLEFGDRLELANCQVTFYPAGHILGSALTYIESSEGNILYTGDYRTPAAAATDGFECPRDVDILITEATFGLPIYRWEPHDVLFRQIRDFARNTLEDGSTPLFLAYNLGKAQELMHILAPLEHPVQIHGAGYRLCPVYEEFDIDLGTYETYDRDSAEGKILIAPSSAHSNQFASHIHNKKIAYCSGWASLESRRSQLTVDKLIPLSDHLDFFELIRICETLQPTHVYLTHTPDPSVIQHYLSQRDISASPLPEQG